MIKLVAFSKTIIYKLLILPLYNIQLSLTGITMRAQPIFGVVVAKHHQ